jgi:hypothetical protein
MYEVKKETLENAYKPYDVVTNKDGDVGFIQEVNVNDSQPSGSRWQISYAVSWLVGDEIKHVWWDHDELTRHCNLFMEIAKASCHPSGRNKHSVELLFKHFQ